ncbi:MAG: trimeric autotransporter adhesin, partial [Candidatus Parcubacteria bacterium]|nr:trimeric autotransporter adhesin [Candidatus Parcubacteria bacterium]
AVNTAGTSTGADLSFTTSACVPTLTTDAAAPSETSATLSGSISATGGGTATARGFSWGETTDYGATTTESGSFSTGSFTADLAALTCATAYHFKAYASNSAGIGYGPDLLFTTATCPLAPSASASNAGRTSGAGRVSISELSTILAPGPATDAYLRSLAHPALACPANYICTPFLNFPNFLAASTSSLDFSSTSVGTSTSSTSAFTRSLQLGDTGTDVRLLQVYLNTHGFPISATGAGSPGRETTLFGRKTKAALIRFQRDRGIPGSGFFGPVTRAYVREHP